MPAFRLFRVSRPPVFQSFVYDRLTRRRDVSGIPNIAQPSSDHDGATERNDFRESRLAQRFGTPGFNGGRL
jgi:hypothetical protein